MEFAKQEVAILEAATRESEDVAAIELNDLQLALVGGGAGVVIIA